jgi:hypothetical protein
MLTKALTDHFQSYFAQANHHDTVLWFDPDQEYTALLDHLTELSLWRYKDNLLQIRYRLIHRAPGERTVVYLPLCPDEAETLRPFFATSFVFRERLYRFLRRQDLDFPDDPQVAHELRTLLPRLAARSVGKGRAFWEYNLANLERARETLLGNFDDTLLRFLAQPQPTLAELKREKLDGLFFAQLESAYGLSATSEDDPEETARRLAAQLILTCAYAQAETTLREHGLEPTGFPYAERLAEPMYRERCWAFATRWQCSTTYGAVYAHLADELQSRYDLTRWAVDLPRDLGLALRATFANVQDALWDHVQKALATLESEDEWRGWLQAHDGPIDARADDFWVWQGRDPGWGLLSLAPTSSRLSTVCDGNWIAGPGLPMPSATMPVAGEVPAEAAIVFNGNIDGDIATLAKTSHLLQPLSDQMKDLALIDRIHFYLPGWEMDKMRPEYLTTHYGLVVDYATEVWRGLRKTSYADVIDRYFSLGSHLNQRDVRAVRKTVSGLVKLLHPNGVFDKEDLQEYLELAMEGRRRVKEQLRRMGGLEFWAVNFSHIDLESRQETFIAVPEQGSGGLITPGVLDPGVTFSVGSDQADGRLAIFRAEVQTVKGNGKLHITGAPSRAARDGIQTAHTYLKTNASRLGLGKNPSDYDLHTQLVNLMGVKEGSELSSIPTPSTPRFGRWGWIER